MSLKTVGKIFPQDTKCLKCSTDIKFYGKQEEISCKCGAHYRILSAEIVGQQIEMEYDFLGFVCIHTGFNEACINSCPAPNMYCKEHSSETAIEQAKRDITYSEQRVEQNRNRLSLLEESRKIWIIQKMSGLDEQDDTVSEN